jgi:hypothetical protein
MKLVGVQDSKDVKMRFKRCKLEKINQHFSILGCT